MSTITEYLEELSGRSVTVIGMGISNGQLDAAGRGEGHGAG